MTPAGLTYAVVTPVRNEEANLPRLAACLAGQTALPTAWIVIDTGSTDRTLDQADGLAGALRWARALSVAGEAVPTRGGPIVRAFTTGVAALGEPPDVVVKLDADLTFEADYFARLLAVFAADPRLGIASGICHEHEDGEWRPLFGTRSHVWGASRAYRWACLQEVLPLEERQGWDEIDSIKAQIRGWHAQTLVDLPFRHHRPEGERDGAHRRWIDQGETAHFMGYRFTYLLARVLYRGLREPASLAMLAGYLRAAGRRQPACADASVRAHLRREQSIQKLPRRIREARGRSA